MGVGVTAIFIATSTAMKSRRHAVIAIGAVAALFLVPGISRATTYTYNLTLTPFSGSGTVSGIGYFKINQAPDPSVATEDLNLIAFSVSLSDGVTYTLADQTSPKSLAQFHFGAFQVIYAIFGDSSSFPWINFSGPPAYYEEHTDGSYTMGSVTATLAPTPLPGALPLFVSALGMIGVLAWRRKRTTQALVT